MRFSIVTRVTMLVVVVIVLAALLIALVMRGSTTTQFLDFEQGRRPHHVDQQLLQATATRLEHAFARSGIEGLVAAAGDNGRDRDLRAASFIVVDRSLDVLATTETPLIDATVRRLENGGLNLHVDPRRGGSGHDLELVAVAPRPLLDPQGNAFGELILLPRPVDEASGVAFAERVWQGALLWLLLVVLLAVVVTAVILRRALRPIDRLTAAAAALGEGSFPEPLAIEGGDADFDRLITTFNTASSTLARTDEIRRGLISDIAHELRTPVTNIKGQIEALEAGLFDANGEFIETVKAESGLLERLIEDFQQLAVADAGQLRLNPEALPLAEIVEAIMKPHVEQANARLAVDIDPAIRVFADEQRLRQILGNLFENAVQHRPEDLEITIRATQRESQVEIDFADNGPGVPAEDQPYIFERFYRAEKSRNRSTGGAGLGLAIVRGLAEAMGGKIVFVHGSTRGATFRMVLPGAPGD